MFPRVYLEVPVRAYLRVSLRITSRAPLWCRDHLQLWQALHWTCVAQHDFVEGVVEGAQPPKMFCQCDFLRHPFATLFFPRARAQLTRYPRVLNVEVPCASVIVLGLLLLAVWSLVWVTSSSETDGCNNAAVIGWRLLVPLLNSLSAGLIWILADFVFLYPVKQETRLNQSCCTSTEFSWFDSRRSQPFHSTDYDVAC